MLQPIAKASARIAKRFVIIGNTLLAVRLSTIYPKSPPEQKFPERRLRPSANPSKVLGYDAAAALANDAANKEKFGAVMSQ
ncbi:MAG: hypothetical protein EOS26_24590 [Mesorhizobium sp.]|nr:MAG: hypothetical protein EOS26_24590 [Mesorhizobium sp.]